MVFKGSNAIEDTSTDALFVGSDVYREAAFGKHHPLSIIRVSGSQAGFFTFIFYLIDPCHHHATCGNVSSS